MNLNTQTSQRESVNRYLTAILLLSLVNFVYLVIFFINKGYLPEPFLHDKNNTFMDFYQPLYWAGRGGIFTIWQSVYPPLNFILFNLYEIFFVGNISDFTDAAQLREIVGWRIAFVLVIYAGLLILVVKESFSSSFTNWQRVIITAICLLSPPTLFALERGNLIFLSLYFLAIYIWGKYKLIKIIAFAFLVNIKPYFIVIYFFEIIRKDCKENIDYFILSPILSILILLISGIILNQEYYLIINNILGFASNSIFSAPEILALPTSILAFAKINELFGHNYIPEFLYILFKIMIWVLILLSLKLIYQKKVSDSYFYIFIVLFLTNYSTTSGGYVGLYYIPIIPLLYKLKEFKILNLIVFTIFLGIWDIIPLANVSISTFDVYLSGEFRDASIDLSAGSIVRPIANYFALLIYYKNLRNRVDV